MLVAATVVPHPPLLVPGVGAGASDELVDLRAAATAGVRRVVDAGVDLLVVVGRGPRDATYEAHAWGSLAGYGVAGALADGAGAPTLPLALTVASWLVDQAGVAVPRLLVSVRSDADPARCAALGAELADRAARVGLVASGDGSARRSLKGPGYLDGRAEPYDASVAAAFATGDGDALLRLDPALSEELLVAGRAAWQVLAGAARGREVTGEVTFAAAPYGVCYLVATWTTAD